MSVVDEGSKVGQGHCKGGSCEVAKEGAEVGEESHAEGGEVVGQVERVYN